MPRASFGRAGLRRVLCVPRSLLGRQKRVNERIGDDRHREKNVDAQRDQQDHRPPSQIAARHRNIGRRRELARLWRVDQIRIVGHGDFLLAENAVEHVSSGAPRSVASLKARNHGPNEMKWLPMLNDQSASFTLVWPRPPFFETDSLLRTCRMA